MKRKRPQPETELATRATFDRIQIACMILIFAGTATRLLSSRASASTAPTSTLAQNSPLIVGFSIYLLVVSAAYAIYLYRKHAKR